MYLYRCGSMPRPADLIHESSERFDNLSVDYTSKYSPRTTSVFTALSLEAAEFWRNNRIAYGLDDELWEIEIPDEEIIYAHNVETFEEAEYALWADEDTEAMSLIESYWEGGIPVQELIEDDPTGFGYEILLPFELAANAKWNLLAESTIELA